eukprot:COSAG06_NODE_2445_length_6866_cov_9.468450_8_plen_43_part_00
MDALLEIFKDSEEVNVKQNERAFSFVNIYFQAPTFKYPIEIQ